MEKKKTAREKPGHEKTAKMEFEKALKELEDIAVKLEDGELSLDESLRRFERGMRLAKYCRDRLDEAERKIEILQKGDDGRVAGKNVAVDGDTGEIDNDDDLQGSLL
jgi:exodeoxyribonuclease VII small subunit